MTVASRPAKRAHGGADRALYVEILITAPLDTVWDLTQEPASHVRREARFTSILPLRSRDDGAEEFRYELVLGIHTIRGTAISLGSSEGRGGERTSALGWGAIGRVLDPLITRRFVWWLTARSFDRLRLWADDGIPPEQTTWWRSLLPGHRPRPRAGQCFSRPPTRSGRTIMQNAPDALAVIAP